MAVRGRALCAAAVLAWAATVSAQPTPPVQVGQVVQALGAAWVQGRPAQAGQPVLEGQHISTGANGYLYLQTVDKGFLVLRPNTSARIPTYRVDAAQPANSRFKIELERGVARSISGQGVPPARQNFRFNTPVAAIGVVGTDFTVFTDTDTTRVAVTSGGVVVSGFGGGCVPDALGPCQTAERQQLLAQQVGQLLQVSRGSVAPQLLRNGSLAPDAVAPPRQDEPAQPSSAGAQAPDTLLPLRQSALEDARRAQEESLPPAIIWGRWQPIADAPASLDLLQSMQQAQLAALDGHFAVLRSRDTPWVMPRQASATFQLRGFDAQVVTPGGVQRAGLDNAQLRVDFGQRSFSTSFDLLLPGGERTARQALGVLGADGTFSNPSQYLGGSNMLVQGVLGKSSGASGLQAGYVFQTRLDDHRTASGVTFWRER